MNHEPIDFYAIRNVTRILSELKFAWKFTCIFSKPSYCDANSGWNNGCRNLNGHDGETSSQNPSEPGSPGFCRVLVGGGSYHDPYKGEKGGTSLRIRGCGGAVFGGTGIIPVPDKPKKGAGCTNPCHPRRKWILRKRGQDQVKKYNQFPSGNIFFPVRSAANI